MPSKKYSKDHKTCRVTFVIPKEAGATSAHVCGDFNDWSRTANPMKRSKDGSFKLGLDLDSGRQYRYRFVLDGDRWENDWQADAYEANSYGSEDSLLEI